VHIQQGETMSTVNASFAKLLEYEQRALDSEEASPGSQPSQGDWAGLAFRLSGTRLVCGMDRVFESLPVPGITRVPGAKAFILGLANVRGDLMTVIDLGCYLGNGRTTTTSRSRLLSASLRGRPVGLLVDEVFGQRNFMSSDADEAPQAAGTTMAGLIRRQRRSGSESWQELDIDALFGAPEFLDGAAT
jgi:twitching motility protein PilI